MIPLVGIEWGNSGSHAQSIVVSKLHKQEQREPVVLLIVAVDPDVLFQGLVSVLGLTIGEVAASALQDDGSYQYPQEELLFSVVTCLS